MNLPRCAYWQVWSGVEIEGEDSLGVETLFVRGTFTSISHKDYEILKRFKRVWFTRDFFDMNTIIDAINLGLEVALEVYLEDVNDLPIVVKEKAKLYVVIPYDLPEGTHIKCGEGYKEFMGKIKAPNFKVSDYELDKVIKE